MKKKKISTQIKTKILEETYKSGSVIAEIARRGSDGETIFFPKKAARTYNNLLLSL